jgi:signal transduction histidine kinase
MPKPAVGFNVLAKHAQPARKTAMASPRWDKWTTSRAVGPLAIVLALLVLVVSELGHQQLTSLNLEREASVKAQLTVGRLRRTLLSMESATRGYMVIGRIEYLEPYRQQAPILEATLKIAEALSREEVQSKPVLAQVVELSRRKQFEMQEMIRLFQSGDRIGAMVLLETDVGEKLMTEISDLVDQAINQEAAKFSAAGEVGASSASVSRLLIWVLVLASLSGASLLMGLSRARERDQRLYMSQLRGERDLLEQEVTRRTVETVDLALHMERVREDERGRLARELHDELGGLMTAAKLDVARIRKRLPETGSGQDLLLHLSQSLDAGISLKRRIIEDLRPSSLSNLGLKATLLIQCKEFAQRAEIAVSTDIADIRLPDDHELVVYRIVQEALTNVAKYAGATDVRVSMLALNGCLELRVVDNGRGFNAQAAESANGRGLQGMRFRVKACAGDLYVHSTPGDGTSVVATFPLQSPAQVDADDSLPMHAGAD